MLLNSSLGNHCERRQASPGPCARAKHPVYLSYPLISQILFGPLPSESSSVKQVEVVAAVLEHEGCILCVQRPANKYLYISEKWEFPGGKVEAGETRAEALVREIEEELTVAVTVGKAVLTVEHQYPDFQLTMHAFHCTLSHTAHKSDLHLNEHEDLRWLAAKDPAFQKLDWAAADVPIVNVLISTEEPKA